MAQLDIARTAFSGFGLIGRNPVSPLIWGLVQTVLAVAPLLLVLPTLLELIATAAAQASTGAEPDFTEIMQSQAQLNVISPLSWLLGLFSYGLITGATFRAVLSPEQKSWFFMRVGMAEVMLVAVTIVWVILFIVAMIPIAVIVGIGAFAGNLASDGLGGILAVILGLAAVGVMIWGALRFSLAFAMSFDRKAFLLFESWKLTSGHALSLFLMALINFIIGLVISWILLAIVLAIVISVALGGGGLEALQQAEDPSAFFTPERLQTLIPLGIGLLLVMSAVNGYISAYFTAPWAEAYRQLVPKQDEVF